MKCKLTLSTVLIADIEEIQSDLNKMRFPVRIVAEEVVGKGQIKAEVTDYGNRKAETYVQVDPEE